MFFLFRVLTIIVSEASQISCVLDVIHTDYAACYNCRRVKFDGESCGILPNNLGLHPCSVMNKLIIFTLCQRNFQTKGANYQHHDCICVCRLEATSNKCQLSLAILLYTHAPPHPSKQNKLDRPDCRANIWGVNKYF